MVAGDVAEGTTEVDAVPVETAEAEVAMVELTIAPLHGRSSHHGALVSAT
jgi:hypothetical protein